MIEDAEYAAWALVSLDYAIGDDVLTVVVEAMGIKRRNAQPRELRRRVDRFDAVRRVSQLRLRHHDDYNEHILTWERRRAFALALIAELDSDHELDAA
jgi:hypothetical protein